MDEFKPEDELKPDPSDRRTGRSRQSSERSERTERGEPQINFDDIELDDTCLLYTSPSPRDCS